MTRAIEGATLGDAVPGAAVAVALAAPDLHRNPATRRRGHNRFYVGISGMLLLIVLIGFAPTLYLRPFFDTPEYPAYLLVHGVVLTAWYVGFFLQTVLVAVHRTDIHRRLGWGLAGLAAAVFVVNAMVVLALVPRRAALGADLEAGKGLFSGIVWGDSAALLSFVIFVATAIILRRRSETHKRLMVLASISLVGPALARIWRWPVFAGLSTPLLSTAAVLTLLLALALYDVISTRRLHPVTLVGGTFFFGSELFALFVISASEFGRSVVRGLG